MKAMYPDEDSLADSILSKVIGNPARYDGYKADKLYVFTLRSRDFPVLLSTSEKFIDALRNREFYAEGSRKKLIVVAKPDQNIGYVDMLKMSHEISEKEKRKRVELEKETKEIPSYDEDEKEESSSEEEGEEEVDEPPKKALKIKEGPIAKWIREKKEKIKENKK